MATSKDLPFPSRLWYRTLVVLGRDQQMAGALGEEPDVAEFKHVVLSLIFLKYLSDSSKVPQEARWENLKEDALLPTIERIDGAIRAIESNDVSLKGVLSQSFAHHGVDSQRLGQLIRLINDTFGSLTDPVSTLAQVYEHFLEQFAGIERGEGKAYTPVQVARVLVDMLTPLKGRVYDPCCGAGEMLVECEKFSAAHGGEPGDLTYFGQELNEPAWRLAKMNLAIHGIDAQVVHADSLLDDRHPELKAEYVLANPPFNGSTWRGDLLRDDPRWVYGTPPLGNANFAWVQHFLYHLAPAGVAGFVLANSSMSSSQPGESEIRQAIIEADLVDCVVALPGQLYYSTQIPACLWILTRNKETGRHDRRGETLFIDARQLGTMVTRVHRELTDEDIAKIANAYHAWRGDPEAGNYSDVAGFCKVATLEDLRHHGHVLTPGRYVDAAAAEEDAEPFNEKMKRLAAQWREQQAEALKLDAAIAACLNDLGF